MRRKLTTLLIILILTLTCRITAGAVDQEIDMEAIKPAYENCMVSAQKRAANSQASEFILNLLAAVCQEYGQKALDCSNAYDDIDISNFNDFEHIQEADSLYFIRCTDADENGIYDFIENGGLDNNLTDTDSDGVNDNIDNCINTPNADQNDIDDDSVGDMCDNCVEFFNPEQADEQEDLCFDSDEDEIADFDDRCPNDPDNNCQMYPADSIGPAGAGGGNCSINSKNISTFTPFLTIILGIFFIIIKKKLSK